MLVKYYAERIMLCCLDAWMLEMKRVAMLMMLDMLVMLVMLLLLVLLLVRALCFSCVKRWQNDSRGAFEMVVVPQP